MSEFHGAADQSEAIATIHRAIALGVNFLDTADMYGRGEDARIWRKTLARRMSH
jgi:aryl-alcohol dehydrogenase-like predicted oxidoreductase